MIKLELNIEQVNVILASLTKQPFEAVAPVIEVIQKQAKPQVDAINEQAKADADAS